MFIILNMNDKENQCIDHEDLQAAHEIRTSGTHLPWKTSISATRDHVLSEACARCLFITTFFSLPLPLFLFVYLFLLLHLFFFLFHPFPCTSLPYPCGSPSSCVALPFSSHLLLLFTSFFLPSFQEVLDSRLPLATQKSQRSF
jgi:hypothetical protein